MKKIKNKTLKNILLVLLCMVFLIVPLASLAVPASAFDPFNGNGTFDFDYLRYVRNDVSSSNPVQISNPLPSEFMFSAREALYITQNSLVLEIMSYFPSFEFAFDYTTMFANDFANFPLVSCNQEVIAVVNGQDISIPAGENIVDYVKAQGAVNGISSIKRYANNFDSTTGPHRFEFTLNPDGVSYQYEGGMRSVFNGVLDWFIALINSAISLFYVNGVLTPIGAVVVVALGFSVILLIFALISRYIRLGG